MHLSKTGPKSNQPRSTETINLSHRRERCPSIPSWEISRSSVRIRTDFDSHRPIYDKATLNIDAFFSYRTRLFSDKIGATFQFSVRNLNERGRLRPIAVDPDGTPSSYRIVAPRQSILNAWFDL